MIRGVVNARHEAIVPLRVQGLGAQECLVDAILDTGFPGSLTLPFATVVALGLARQSGGGATMADGTIRHYDQYAASVAWDGGWRPVLVSVIGNEALLGMQLLGNHELRIEEIPGGDVEITPTS